MNAVGFYGKVKTVKKEDAGRIKSITTKTLSDFIRLEEGSTGKQNALKAGAVIGGSVLAQVLLNTGTTDAHTHTSGGPYWDTSHWSISWGSFHFSDL